MRSVKMSIMCFNIYKHSQTVTAKTKPEQTGSLATQDKKYVAMWQRSRVCVTINAHYFMYRSGRITFNHRYSTLRSVEYL